MMYLTACVFKTWTFVSFLCALIWWLCLSSLLQFILLHFLFHLAFQSTLWRPQQIKLALMWNCACIARFNDPEVLYWICICKKMSKSSQACLREKSGVVRSITLLFRVPIANSTAKYQLMLTEWGIRKLNWIWESMPHLVNISCWFTMRSTYITFSCYFPTSDNKPRTSVLWICLHQISPLKCKLKNRLALTVMQEKFSLETFYI